MDNRSKSVAETAEKERVRTTIANQTQRYLADGGSITVLPVPQPENGDIKGSAWHLEFDMGFHYE